MKVFFNSSMPRAGSTLLQNILASNPDIYATPTSGLLPMLAAAKRVYTAAPAFKAQDPKQMKAAFLKFCRRGVEGFFEGLTDRPCAIDKSRGWLVNWDFVNAFMPEPKMICMVRDLREVLASMEKNHRKHPDKWEPGTDPSHAVRITVGQRVSGWMREKPVGVMLQNLKEVLHRKHDRHILFVRYEDLCCEPDREMRRVYDYLGLPFFQHDFGSIPQVTQEDDRFHGRYADHRISSALKAVPPCADEFLGRSLASAVVEKNAWYFSKFAYQ